MKLFNSFGNIYTNVVFKISNFDFKGWTFLILGVIFLLWAFFGSFYVGGWIFFVGGIADVVRAVQVDPIPAMTVGLGCLKVTLASFFGVCNFLGSALLSRVCFEAA